MVPKEEDCTDVPKPFNRRTIGVCGTGSIGKAHASAIAIAASNIKTVLVVGYKTKEQFTIDINKLKQLNKEEFQQEVETLAAAFNMSANKIASILVSLQQQTERTTRSMEEMGEALAESMHHMKYEEAKVTPKITKADKMHDRYRKNHYRKSKW